MKTELFKILVGNQFLLLCIDQSEQQLPWDMRKTSLSKKSFKSLLRCLRSSGSKKLVMQLTKVKTQPQTNFPIVEFLIELKNKYTVQKTFLQL